MPIVDAAARAVQCAPQSCSGVTITGVDVIIMLQPRHGQTISGQQQGTHAHNVHARCKHGTLWCCSSMHAHTLNTYCSSGTRAGTIKCGVCIWYMDSSACASTCRNSSRSSSTTINMDTCVTFVSLTLLVVGLRKFQLALCVAAPLVS